MRKHCVLLGLKDIIAINNKETTSKRQTVIFSTCLVNMGLTWSFGFALIFPIHENVKTAFAFLFCLFNSFQGFLIFAIYILLSKSRRKLAGKKFRKFKESLFAKTNHLSDIQSNVKSRVVHTESTETKTSNS